MCFCGFALPSCLNTLKRINGKINFNVTLYENGGERVDLTLRYVDRLILNFERTYSINCMPLMHSLTFILRLKLQKLFHVTGPKMLAIFFTFFLRFISLHEQLRVYLFGTIDFTSFGLHFAKLPKTNRSKQVHK